MFTSTENFRKKRTAILQPSFSLLATVAATAVMTAAALYSIAFLARTSSASTVSASDHAAETAQAAVPVWRYRNWSLRPNWPSAQIVSEPRVDTRGGEVVVSMRGLEIYYCPRKGVEKVRFKWEFNRDVSVLRPGEDLGVNLHVEPVTRDNYCTGQLEANSYAEALNSNNAQYSKDETLFHGEAIRWKKGESARGGDRTPSLRNATSVLTVNPQPVYLDKTMARFAIKASGPCDDPAPYSCGAFYFQYNYDLDSTGTGGSNACGYSIGSGILGKWNETGGQSGYLGCARSGESEAGRSPFGTSGRYALFSGWANAGVIIWHANGRLAGRAFAVHGAIGQLYQSLGGTNSWLGFPISDEYPVPGGRRSDFEGGYIFWDEKTGRTQAFKYPTADYKKTMKE